MSSEPDRSIADALLMQMSMPPKCAAADASGGFYRLCGTSMWRADTIPGVANGRFSYLV
jgi:hypothetical protein